jgi:hypothetical protein
MISDTTHQVSAHDDHARPVNAPRGVPGWVHVSSLVAISVQALIVGFWAYVVPRGFYDVFPAVAGSWIHQDGPYNQHLIQDVGAMYIALGLASVGALLWRRAQSFRLLGIAWTVFGLLHFSYHSTHLAGMSATDALGNVVGLGLYLLLGITLLIPSRKNKEANR